MRDSHTETDDLRLDILSARLATGTLHTALPSAGTDDTDPEEAVDPTAAPGAAPFVCVPGGWR